MRFPVTALDGDILCRSDSYFIAEEWFNTCEIIIAECQAPGTENGLAPYAQDGIGLEQFIGRITQQEELEIPAWANTLSFEADGLYTELCINGEKMAERLNAPCIWRIPERFAGKKVEIKIERCTSCGPMFGVKRFDDLRPGDESLWLNCSRPSGRVKHPVAELVFQ